MGKIKVTDNLNEENFNRLADRLNVIVNELAEEEGAGERLKDDRHKKT